MNIIRTKNIPIIITVFAILIGLLGIVLGLRAMFDPTTALGYMDGADSLALSWGGRNAGLGVALLMAVFLRDANAYVAAWAGSIMREVSDIISMSADGLPIPLVIFLLIEVAFLVISLRAALQNRQTQSSAS